MVLFGSYLYPNGQDFNPHLKAEVDEVERVLVTEEEQEIYHLMDSTYEECKLCYEFPKDSRIEPCGHLICKQCLEKIRVSQSNLFSIPPPPLLYSTTVNCGYLGSAVNLYPDDSDLRFIHIRIIRIFVLFVSE